MFTGWERPSHWLVLAVVVVVLFGYKKLPDAARAVGRSLRIFKTEMKGMSEDDKARDSARSADASTPAVEPPAPKADAEGAAPITDQAPSTPAESSQPTPRAE